MIGQICRHCGRGLKRGMHMTKVVDTPGLADRFHLLQNLREMTERLLDREMKAIHAAEARMPETVKEPPALMQERQPPQRTQTAQQPAVRSSRRQERFDRVQELHAQGVSIHGIVRALDVSRNTVRKYLRASECPPSAARPRRPSLLDPFKAYVTSRWEAGCTNSAQRYRAIKVQGFGGSDSIVRDWATHYRLPQANAPRQSHRRLIAARGISWLLVRPQTTLREEEQTRVLACKANSEVIDVAYPLIQTFGTMVRERQADHLEQWLCAAEHSGQVE